MKKLYGTSRPPVRFTRCAARRTPVGRGRGLCEPWRDVELRVLLVLAAALVVTRIAQAQAPPPSFFAGRSNDDLRALASDLHNGVLLRRSAATRLVTSLADAGDFDAADAAAREFAKNVDPTAVRHANALRQRSHVHRAALGTLAIGLGLAASSLIAAHRSLRGALRALLGVAPVTTFFFSFAGLVGGALASCYENGSPLPFISFAALMLPLVAIFRMWSAVGSPRLAARVGRGALAVAATFALGFVVIEQLNPMYLEGFGL